jgi:excinuclease UvrABC nuclease subunit
MRTYCPLRSAVAGDWHKANKLQASARSVLILACPTHFEACLLELYLIRILAPKYNSMSLGSGKLYYVQECKQSGDLLVSQRRRAGFRSWGFLRQRSTLEFAFDALSKVLDGYNAATREFSMKFVAGTPVNLKRQKRLQLVIKKDKSESAKALLRGKSRGPMMALWKKMKEAALNQQYHHAATLRDMFFALRQFQNQLKRSRRISRFLKNVDFVIGDPKNNSARNYTLKSFGLQKIAQRGGIIECSQTSHFVSVITSAAKIFSDECDCKTDLERLKVNFEFLRLMLWWHDNKPEPCSLGSADDGI